MNKAIDIARYTINYSIEIGHPISHLKLQKILYYIQAAFLVKYNKPAFSEEIVNWTYGPVVPEVYYTFKQFGYNTIEEKILVSSELIIDPITLDVSFEYKDFDNKVFESDTLALMSKIIDVYKDDSPIKMMKKTHEEDPWKNTKNGEVISPDKIQQYYVRNVNLLCNNRCVVCLE